MARLYVANCTGQNRQVNYRIDYTVDDQGRRTSERLVPYKTQTLPARQQQMFGSDWHPVQIQDIVEQLEKSCGAVHSSAVKTAKRMGVVKLIWQEDKPITLPILKDVIEHNMGLLDEQGAARRRQLALVADTQLTQLLDRAPPKLEMEFEQVEEEPDFGAKLEEGIRVNHAAKPKPAPRGRRKAA
jgi:hypothetical protein